MKIVICGSVTTSKEEIQHVQQVLNSLLPSANITTPIHEKRQMQPLLSIQTEYAKALHDADLVVIVPKKIEGAPNGGTNLKMDIGESTTYEMATARYAMKPVIFWPNFQDLWRSEIPNAISTTKKVKNNLEEHQSYRMDDAF